MIGRGGRSGRTSPVTVPARPLRVVGRLFFFSGRRRHTRFSRDWSSDVCSSDLVERVGRRVPVLTGVAECTTALACRFAEDARRIGVAGLMVLPGMVYKSDSREAMAHYRAVARATDLPIMVYNNPVSYHVDIT